MSQLLKLTTAEFLSTSSRSIGTSLYSKCLKTGRFRQNANSKGSRSLVRVNTFNLFTLLFPCLAVVFETSSCHIPLATVDLYTQARLSGAHTNLPTSVFPFLGLKACLTPGFSICFLKKGLTRESGLKTQFPPHTSECWDYSCAPPCPANGLHF